MEDYYELKIVYSNNWRNTDSDDHYALGKANDPEDYYHSGMNYGPEDYRDDYY